MSQPPRRAPVGSLVPKVSDFGLARLAGQEGVTAAGEILGTPGYMPPEQASGRTKDVDRRSDVYSLGAVLYCLVTGRPPFQAATMMETLRLVQDQDPVPPRRLNPAVTRDLEAVCLKCLEKEPRRRYVRAADLATDLQRFLDGRPTLARPVSRVGRVRRWALRRPALAGMAVVCAAAVFALAAGAVAYTLELRAHNAELGEARGKEQKQREASTRRGRLLQRKAYGGRRPAGWRVLGEPAAAAGGPGVWTPHSRRPLGTSAVGRLLALRAAGGSGRGPARL